MRFPDFDEVMAYIGLSLILLSALVSFWRKDDIVVLGLILIGGLFIIFASAYHWHYHEKKVT